MDLIAIVVGVIVGLAIGFAIAWVWANSLNNAKSSAMQATEAELKALLAEQAKTHLRTSRATIKTLERELASLSSSVSEYENMLTLPSEDYSKNNFFGEHASVFLRNTDNRMSKSVEIVSTEDQPKDFANSGSGVFVGTPAIESNEAEEKTKS